MGITRYPPLGEHIAFAWKRAVLFGFASGRFFVGSELLPTTKNTGKNKVNKVERNLDRPGSLAGHRSQVTGHRSHYN